MGRPLYSDLDETLITSRVDRRGNVLEIFPRPGASEFIRKLSRHGDLFLLTHATRPHVENAFRALGPAARLFSGVISREDLEPVIEQVEYLLANPSLTDEERAMLYREIRPLAPRGFIFDDQAVDSIYYLYKTAATGGRPSDWIRVPAFTRDPRDRALETAYQEYISRAGGQHAVLGRRARKAIG